MKTTKTTSTPKKKSKTSEVPKRKNSTGKKYLPTEDEIREKAKQIYHQRIERGESGTAENDWIEAEKYLSNSK